MGLTREQKKLMHRIAQVPVGRVAGRRPLAGFFLQKWLGGLELGDAGEENQAIEDAGAGERLNRCFAGPTLEPMVACLEQKRTKRRDFRAHPVFSPREDRHLILGGNFNRDQSRRAVVTKQHFIFLKQRKKRMFWLAHDAREHYIKRRPGVLGGLFPGGEASAAHDPVVRKSARGRGLFCAGATQQRYVRLVVWIRLVSRAARR